MIVSFAVKVFGLVSEEVYGTGQKARVDGIKKMCGGGRSAGVDRNAKMCAVEHNARVNGNI